LLFRFALAGMVLMHIPQFSSATGQAISTITCFGVCGLLVFGLMTPLAALVGICIGGVCLACGHPGIVAHLTFLMLMLSLSLIGAGAYSIDARLYGRREVVLGRNSAPPAD
jgi:uncharacterized membrane protein YphA (DoxX/SURF4 family)